MFVKSIIVTGFLFCRFTYVAPSVLEEMQNADFRPRYVETLNKILFEGNCKAAL